MRSNEEILTLIERIMKEKGISQNELARRVDVSRSTISRYMNRTRQFPVNNVDDYAQALGITSEYLLGVQPTNKITTIYKELNASRKTKVIDFAEKQLSEQRYIEEHDYVGQTAAGVPIEGQQPVPMIGSETVRLIVNGDSMEPKYLSGDIIEYHPQPELENGEIGVFAINGGITLKRFRRNSGIHLESLNKKYEDIIIKDTDDFNILGKVL